MPDSATENNGSGSGEQFGFTTVGEGERQGLVNQVFATFLDGRYYTQSFN